MKLTHICVLYGGRSLEREVSVATGHRVMRALRSRGYKVSGLDADEKLIERLDELRPDLVFIAMHGKGGEDGTVQELLEIMDLPYTGSGVLPSVRMFDKVLTKHILNAEGIPTPAFYAFNEAAFRELGAKDALPTIVGRLGLPLVVKPAAQGSALGISIVRAIEDLPEALATALSFDGKVLLEKYVKGRELAVSVLGHWNASAVRSDSVSASGGAASTGGLGATGASGADGLRLLPIVEAVPGEEHAFYDFDSRYVLGQTEFIVPAEIEVEIEAEVMRVSEATYRALRCHGFGRVDLILDEAGIPWVLEVNTIPGLTESSLMPLAAEAAGLSFEDLVQAMVDSALGGLDPAE